MKRIELRPCLAAQKAMQICSAWLLIVWILGWSPLGANAETKVANPVTSQQNGQIGQNTGSATDKLPVLRIVSLLPSLTEMVCALEACDRLVGIDNHANWPAQVNRLPRLGGLGQINVEAVLRLKPDLVLLPRSARLSHRLQQLGLRVLELEPQNTAQAHQAWLEVAQTLGRTDGESRWAAIQQEVDAIAQQIQPKAKGLKVYFEVSDAPYAAGPGSFIGELMTRLGSVNVVPPDLGAFPKLSHEFVLKSRPDVVIASKHSKSPVVKHHPWRCTMTSVQNDALVRPGPRMAEAAKALQMCIQASPMHTHIKATRQGVTP